MQFSLYGMAVPLLLEKAAFNYLDYVVPGLKRRAVKKCYRAIVARQPEVGGVTNHLIKELYLAAYVMAVYKADPERVTEEVFDGLIKEICESDRFIEMNKGQEFFTYKNMVTWDLLQDDPDLAAYPDNWKYTFEYNMEAPECYIRFTRCAICGMAHREECFHLMKYICAAEYTRQALMGNTLVRSKSIGKGDRICSFHIIGGRAASSRRE